MCLRHLGYLLLLTWYFQACTSDFQKRCKKTKVEENVTLRGGIGAGTFRKLAKVSSMASCIDLCCKRANCDVAFMSDMKCYGVECVSDDECESTTTDTSDTKVLIAHVRKGRKTKDKSLILASIPKHNTPKLLKIAKPTLLAPKTPAPSTVSTVGTPDKAGGKIIPVNPGLAGQCKAGDVHKEVTLKGGINAGTYKDVGAVKDITECADRCCGYAQCDLAFMLHSRCYLVGCKDAKNCQLQKAKPSPFQPSIEYVTRWNSEGVKHSINLQEKSGASYQCSPMKLMNKVTLKGGLKAGDFTDTGKAEDINECYSHCCQQPTCNLAFMLGQNCFSVKCFNKDLCSTIPAQPSIYNPQIAYVYNRKGVTQTEAAVAKSKVPKPPPKCPGTKIFKQVTLYGGLGAGSFHDNGKVKSMIRCKRICCEKPRCNLAFMLGTNCFSVECKNVDVCRAQPAKPSNYAPQISYIRPVGSNDLIEDPKDTKITPSTPAAPKTSTVLTTLPPKTTKPKPVLIPSTTSSQAPMTSETPPGMPAFPPGMGAPSMPGTLGDQEGLLGGIESNSVMPGQPMLSPFAGGGMMNPLNAQQSTTLPPQPVQITNPVQAMLPGFPLPVDQSPLGMEPVQPAKPVIPSALDAMMSQTSPPDDSALLPNVPGKEPDLLKNVEPPIIPAAKPPKPVLNLTSTISKARPGQAMTMKIVDGKLQLAPVDASSNETAKTKADEGTKPHGAFDAIFGHSASDDKCMAAKVLIDVTLKGGKKAGKFKDHGDVKDMTACKKLCCEEDECNLAFMLEKTCYTVTCKNKDLCDHTPAPPSEYKPRVSYVRPLDDDVKDSDNLQKIPEPPANLRCKTSNISNDRTLSGPMGKENFTLIHDVEGMSECMTKCCENPNCDIAYYVDSTCYAVNCTSKEACRPVKGKAKGKIPLMAAMFIKPKAKPKPKPKPKVEEDVTTDLAADLGDEDEDKSSEADEVTNLLGEEPKHTCKGSRISSGVALHDNKGDNFTSMGKVENIKKCIALCCVRPRCDIAYLENNKCFAVHCNDGVLCQTTAHQADLGMNVKLAYMDRNKHMIKERDWMLMYIIIGSLAFAAGLGGVVWAVCICTKRNQIIKQRRLLEDEEDEDDEMLPKPTQTRYRTPMHRY